MFQNAIKFRPASVATIINMAKYADTDNPALLIS
jgi:hypothetical protein